MKLLTWLLHAVFSLCLTRSSVCVRVRMFSYEDTAEAEEMALAVLSLNLTLAEQYCYASMRTGV